jgi:hypothetical protein
VARKRRARRCSTGAKTALTANELTFTRVLNKRSGNKTRLPLGLLSAAAVTRRFVYKCPEENLKQNKSRRLNLLFLIIEQAKPAR